MGDSEEGKWPEGLVEFWKLYEPPGIHPADEPHIPPKKRAEWGREAAGPHTEMPRHLKLRVHKNLIAQPFLGSPTEAQVYIVFGNPGCAPGDYEDELSNEAYMSLCRAHLQGEHHEFLQLEPGAEGTGGWRYYRRVFKRLAEELGMLIAPDLS